MSEEHSHRSLEAVEQMAVMTFVKEAIVWLGICAMLPVVVIMDLLLIVIEHTTLLESPMSLHAMYSIMMMLMVIVAYKWVYPEGTTVPDEPALPFVRTFTIEVEVSFHFLTLASAFVQLLVYSIMLLALSLLKLAIFIYSNPVCISVLVCTAIAFIQ